MSKINKTIECPNCGLIGYVRVRKKYSVSRKGDSWTKKRCLKCNYLLPK